MASTNPGAAVTQTNNPQTPFSNMSQMAMLSVLLSPASVAANTTVEQSFAVTGVQISDMAFVAKPSSQAGLAVSGARISAASTVSITFVNATASPIVPTAAEAYLMLIGRPQPFIVGAVPSVMPLL